MTIKTMVIVGVLVVLCGWLSAWAVWPEADHPTDVQTVGLTLAGLDGQLRYLRSEMDGLKKEVRDYEKNVLIYKHAVLAAKGRVLNQDQDIQQMMAEVQEEVTR